MLRLIQLNWKTKIFSNQKIIGHLFSADTFDSGIHKIGDSKMMELKYKMIQNISQRLN